MARAPDLSFEALVEVTGATVSSERGALNSALKQIREASPDLDDQDLAVLIQLKATQYRKAWPGVALTPTALAKHWNRVEEEQPKPTYQPRPDSSSRCPTCDDHKMVLVGHRQQGPFEVGKHRYEPSRHPDERGHEQYAPCPDCNSDAHADFWRVDGSRFRPPDPARVRELMEL